ncbi:MAG: HAMP domain-containing histidine kinase [Deltaproteobacteria bacterium]|nr:HAMP domain-containing histidine kinase [Deltaproteobacteria bacterium]
MAESPASQMAASRAQTALLAAERYLRTHPGAVGMLAVCAFVVIGVVHLRADGELSMAITYVVPLAVCAYALGAVAGATMAIGIAVLFFLDAINRDFTIDEAVMGFTARVVGNLGIVAISAVAAMAARAREHYLEAQQDLVSLRADLVSAFSHDLRAPLTAITGYAELLRYSPGGDAALPLPEALDRILANAARIDHLIGDMLVAGEGASVPPVQASRFAPEELVAALRAEFDDAPCPSGVSLSWVVAPETPPLQTDRDKLMSVVRNLVGNALKFTSEGSVAVRLGYDREAGMHRIEVADTGPGIAAEELTQVFQRFYRAARTSQRGGFGVGLFIVKRFTELLGGTVSVQSQLGRGTAFVVSLPAAAQPAGAPPTA